MAYCRGASSVFGEWADISGIEGLKWDNLVDDFRISTHLEVPLDPPYEYVLNKSVYDNGHVSVSQERQLLKF